ncbi:DUF4140 domain-containing protein [Micromonospora sp. BRA006-A]|nr:DUF4140 domain-containing protein [Micromonospora sp. BRA006-A]
MDTLEIDAPVVGVTVYPDRARVTRRGRVRLAAGDHRVRVAPLPLGLRRDSIRVGGRGAVTVLGWTWPRGGRPAAPTPRSSSWNSGGATWPTSWPRSVTPTRSRTSAASSSPGLPSARVARTPGRWPRATRPRPTSRPSPTRWPVSSPSRGPGGAGWPGGASSWPRNWPPSTGNWTRRAASGSRTGWPPRCPSRWRPTRPRWSWS